MKILKRKRINSKCSLVLCYFIFREVINSNCNNNKYSSLVFDILIKLNYHGLNKHEFEILK